jgi:uncharacterized protein
MGTEDSPTKQSPTTTPPIEEQPTVKPPVDTLPAATDHQKSMAVSQLFSAGAPESAGWIRVEGSLSTYWRLILLISTIIVWGLAVALGLLASHSSDTQFIEWVSPVSVSIAVIISVVVFVWVYIVIGRRVASIGYRLKDRELEVSSGILFQRLVSVPFARMQLVEVTAGPLERLFGIAGVQLHTASASTNAKIPGLTPTNALSLRDSLNTFGEQAGL